MIVQQFPELHNHFRQPLSFMATLVNTEVVLGVNSDLDPGDAYLKLDPPEAVWATLDEYRTLRISSQVRTGASLLLLVGPQLPGLDGAEHEIEGVRIETTARDVTVGGHPRPDSMLCIGDLGLKTTGDGLLRVHDLVAYVGPLYLDQVESRVRIENVWQRVMQPGFSNLLGR